MNYVEAPYPYQLDSKLETSIFLGGGITNCSNWQATLTNELNHLVVPITVFNPRRKKFDLSDPKQSDIQIRWEHQFLRLCDVVVFYFSHETVCPITLFELGAALERNLCRNNPQKIIVYCEHNYVRKMDVGIQVQLINDLYEQPIKFARVHDVYSHFVSDVIMELTYISSTKHIMHNALHF